MAKSTPHFNDLMKARGGMGISAPAPGAQTPSAPPPPKATTMRPPPPAQSRVAKRGVGRQAPPPPNAGGNGW